MAWDDRDDRGFEQDKELPARPPWQRGPDGRPRADDPSVQREEEEEQWGPIGSLLWYVVAGGKQCCSMRDRTKPADQEAARRASQTGRPPAGQFPEPRLPSSAADQAGRASPYPRTLGGRANSDREPAFPKDDSPKEDFNPYAASREVPPPVPPSREKLSPPPAAKLRPSLDGELPRPSSSAASRAPEPLAPAPWSAPSSAPSRAAVDVPKLGLDDSLAATRQPNRPPVSQPQAPAEVVPKSTDSTAPRRWEWPPWCLNFKEPCIEVFVVDDDDGGQGRWVEAEPQSRVVDKAGRDAYLCAEYEWDGEFYVQDFGPQHVRRRGQKTTVFELFEKGSRDDLSRTRDQGGGVMAFLQD